MREILISPKSIILTQTTGADDAWQRDVAREKGSTVDGQYRHYDLEWDGNANEPDKYSREDRQWPFINMDKERNPEM